MAAPERLVALTFDAEQGEATGRNQGSQGWADILDVLKRHKVVATFFLQGTWAAQHPRLTRRTAAEGHLVGNHTLDHVDLGRFPHQLCDQVHGATEAIGAVLPGLELRPWFRLPYFSGKSSPDIQATLHETGWEHIDRTCDTRDWHPESGDASAVAATALESILSSSAPSVVLFHTWPAQSAAAVDILIKSLREAGDNRFVAVNEISAHDRAQMIISNDPDENHICP